MSGSYVFRNLTPHPLVVYRLDCNVPLMTLTPETPFRLAEEDVAVATASLAIQHAAPDSRTQQINYPDGWSEDGNYWLGCPVVSRRLCVGEGLLPKENATDPLLPYPVPILWVVSLPALMGLRAAGVTRRDIVAPDTGPGPFGAVRDEQGNILGVRRFIHLMGDSGETFASGQEHAAEWPAEEWLAKNRVPPKYPHGNIRPC